MLRILKEFTSETKALEEKTLQVFGENLRLVRKEKGITQEELATLIGLTRTSVTNMESGKQDTPISTMVKITRALGCDIIDLFPNSKEYIK